MCAVLSKMYAKRRFYLVLKLPLLQIEIITSFYLRYAFSAFVKF